VVGEQLLRLAWSLPLGALFAAHRPVTVLYHGVPTATTSKLPAAVFEQHIVFLKRHFQIVSAHSAEDEPGTSDRRRIVLTFDDGFRNNAEVVAPILRKYDVPATFFVCSRHAVPGKYLWFAHLRALEEHFPRPGFHFRGRFFDMSRQARYRSMQRLKTALLRLRPHPASMYEALEQELPALEEFVSPGDIADSYAGMTAAHVAQLAADPAFSIGAHTIDHPFLTLCEAAEVRRQIVDNREWLEAASGRRCDAIAYPAGDYNRDNLRVCREAGFARGYAVSPSLRGRSRLEQARIGIYAASTNVLGFKVQWGHLMRAARLPIG
jgi:peptidoglycan/xylan/chitin deacetylase (PgdA/CDA1 family)